VGWIPIMANSKRILLVEDDHDVAQGTSMRLRRAGYHVIHAADGEQGVSEALKHGPDAILLDVRMPRMNGLDVLEELRKSHETMKIPVVMLSASLLDQQAALEAGARYFLKKPYDRDTLLAAVECATKNPNLHLNRGCHEKHLNR
ncbi:MAG: response regulator, partial [Planctomycetales bacterium]|nr:response regulator [Planctomycetales bacterium]